MMSSSDDSYSSLIEDSDTNYLVHSPINDIITLLERLEQGQKPDPKEVRQILEMVKGCSTEDLRKPLNLKTQLLFDKRFSVETGNALYSMIGDSNEVRARRSLDYRPRASISSFPEKHIFNTAQTSWNFNAFDLKMQQPLTHLAMYLISGEDLIKRLRIDRSKLFNFFSIIETFYTKVPYHNSFHACSVLQYLHILLTSGGVKDRCQLDEQTILACYVAAAAHDVGHKGLTNDFMIKTNDDIAITYNDNSPLENYHASTCIRTLRSPECNFLTAESLIDTRNFKSLICKLILMTDIKQHFQMLSIFQDTDCACDNLPSLQMAMKCADLSHLCNPEPIHIDWVQRLQNEFWRQGDVERLRGMSVSQMMDRRKSVQVIDTQVGFFEVVAMPMFKAFSTCFKDTRQMTDAAQKNLNMWYRAQQPSSTTA